MGNQRCNTCGTIVKIDGSSKSVTMCNECYDHFASFQDAIEKEQEEFKILTRGKNER